MYTSICLILSGVYGAKLKISSQGVKLELWLWLWLIRGYLVTIVSNVRSLIVSLLPKYLQMNTDTERKDSGLTESPEAADFYGWQLMVTHW